MLGSGNVLKMIQSLFFADSEHLGNFPQIETCLAQGYGNFLAQRKWLLCGGIDSPGVFSRHGCFYSIDFPRGLQPEFYPFDFLWQGFLVMIHIIAFPQRM